MLLKSLLFLLGLGLTHTNDDVVSKFQIRSFNNFTDYNRCSDTLTTYLPVILPVSSPSSPTTAFSTTPSSITKVYTTLESTSERPSSSAAVPEETTAPSTTITALSSSTVVSFSSSPSTVTSTVLPTSSTEETTARQEESTTSASTGPGSDSSVAFSSSSTSTETEIDSTSAAVTSGSLSTSPSTADPTSQASTSISRPASPALSTSSTAPTTTLSSSSLSSILGLSSTIPSSSSVSTKTPTTVFTTEGKTSSSAHSSLSTLATEETSTSSGTTILDRSSYSPGITSAPSPTGSPLDTTMPTTAQETTLTPTKASSTTQDVVTSTITSPSLPSTTQPGTTAFENSSPVTSIVSPSLSPFSSGLQGDTSSGSHTTELVSSSSLSSIGNGVTSTPMGVESTEAWKTTGSTEDVSTPQATETSGGTSSTALDMEMTTFTSSTGPSTLSTTEMDSSTSFSSTVTPGKSSQTTTSDPTTRPPPIEVRRTAPGQQQQHPTTSSEWLGTTVEGVTDITEKKTIVTAISMATTLKEILSGRRYVTPVRPATTSTAWNPSSPAPAETSSSPTSSTRITTGISSKNPATPWELPMTAVQTTKKEILSGRRYVTPEKTGIEKASTTIGSESVETTVLSTADTTIFASGTTEKIGTTIVSNSTSTGVTAPIEISSSVSSSTQSVTSTPEQTSVETSPLLATSTEMDSSTKVASSSVSSSAATTSTFDSTTKTETASTLTSKTVVETTVKPTTTGPSTSPTLTSEMKETTEVKSTSTSESATQELEMTSLPFTSTAPSTIEELLSTTETTASPTFSTGNERSGTSAGTTSGPTTLRSQIYGQGCEERCPEGALAGSGRCYLLAPENYYLKFHLSFSYCGRDRVGHLIEKEELMQDLLLIRKWMGNMNYAANTSIFVGPFVTVGSQVRGEYTNLSRISGGLVPTEIIKMEEIRNAVGICAVPEFCGTFNCSFEPLYQSLRGLLAEPMPSPVSPGTAVSVQCLSPSNTVLALKCDSYGKFNPRPGTAAVTCRVSQAFNKETPVPGNRQVRESCDCYEDGTDTCQAVEGGFKCECKKNWRKFSCWKSPDMCWVPTGHVNKCNGHGKCHSYPDLFVCKCDSGFGGETCALNVTNVTWFGSPDSVPFWTAGKAVTVVVTGVEWVELALKAALKSSGMISSDGPTDPLSYTSSMRKVTVAAAGVGMILYAHPHFYFDLWGFGCRLVFLFVNIAMLFAFWLLIMESFTTFAVYAGLGRNRWILGVEKAKEDNWSEVDEPEDKWFLAKPFTIYLGVAFSILVEFYLFTWFFELIPSPYTCLGEIYSLRNPATMVNLEIMAAMAYIASGFAILSQVFKRLWPEVMGEQRSFFEYHKGRIAIEVLNKVERCQYLQCVQAPVILLTYGFAVWSQDQVASGRPQTIEFYLSIPLVCSSILISAIGVLSYSPFIYGHAMKALLPRLPWLKWAWSVYTPAEHGYLSHSEVVNRKQNLDVVLPENEDWPKHPSEKAYIAIERRHQCQRRLTRQYLEMRLMGVVKEDALELIAGRFLLAIPEGDPESAQWEHLLKTWTREVRRIDTTQFEIPRNRAETREQYWNRVLGASLFTRADVLRENSDWMRMFFIFQILGHIPLEKVNGSRRYQQVRHHHQFEEFKKAWNRLETQEEWKKIASLLSPELFPDQDKIEKVRGGARQGHTVLVDLPAVQRYLWMDFYNKAFFLREQLGIRRDTTDEEAVLEPDEHRLERIQQRVLERRVIPRTITHLGRAEWLAGHDLITLYQPSAPILIGANDQPREAVRIPPLVIERNGLPTSLYRW